MRTLSFVLLLVVTGFSGTGKKSVYRIGDSAFEGYYADAGKDAPFILIIHDWDGLTDYEMKRAEMLRKQGYSVFAADLFGKGIRPESIEEKKRLTGALYADRAVMRERMLGAIDAARSRGAAVENGVAVGYCFGGTAVLELARAGTPFKGFVSFHGGLVTPDDQDYSKMKGTLLVLHGSADGVAPPEQLVALAKKLDKTGIAHEMVLYGGADHAFTVFGGERYDKNADEHSWFRFISFLEEVFGKGDR